MKRIIEKIPLIGPVARWVYRKWTHYPGPFEDSKSYWISRYDVGGNSGRGSYGALAEFKAKILNRFVRENDVQTLIEYGCGDGAQLSLAKYPSYIGFDVSPRAISLCSEMCSGDATKKFALMDEYNGERAQVTLSLDVIFHLIEDDVFVEYMHRLFDSAEEYVIIYSSNTDENRGDRAPHFKNRKFSDWVESEKPEWDLLDHVPNEQYERLDGKTGTIADFYIYRRASPRIGDRQTQPKV